MLSKFHEKQNEEGFTLIELLVVIIIIGILAAIAIPTFLGQRERARRGAVQSDLRNMAINAETYFTDEQSYEDFTEGNDWNTFTPSTGVVLAGFWANGGFCVNGYYLTGDQGDAIPAVGAPLDAVSQLPADDGGGWVYDSTASPQLQDFADGTPCVDAANNAAGNVLEDGDGTGAPGGVAGVSDGREPAAP